MLDLMVSTPGFSLDGETLAPLSTTGSEDSATTLGGHAGTEAVALGALAFVRLIGAFHCSTFPFMVQRIAFKLYTTDMGCQRGTLWETVKALRGTNNKEREIVVVIRTVECLRTQGNARSSPVFHGVELVRFLYLLSTNLGKCRAVGAG